MKKFYLLVNTLLIVLLMVGCNPSNVVITSETQDFNLDGKYYAKEIYHVLNNGDNSSCIIDIKDNKIDEDGFKEIALQSDFNIVLNYSTEVSFKKDTMCFYAEKKVMTDSTLGWYLFNQDEMYLFNVGYSEKSGYYVYFGYIITNIDEYFSGDHYYVYKSGLGSSAYDKDGFNENCLELVKTKEELHEYCEKYNITSKLSENNLKKINQLDPSFFEKYAIVIYSTQINVSDSLLVDSIKVDNTKLTINMNLIVPDYFVVQIVRPWSTIIVVEKSILNGVEDVVVERVIDVE